MGVPSIRSAPRTSSTGPTSGRISMPSSFTLERPKGLGRKGERVANTPIRVLPPKRGGRTVGDHVSRTAPENCHTSQMWLKSSSPRTASALRYSGVKMISPRRLSTSPLCRGMPNLVGKAVRMWAMTFSVMASLDFWFMADSLLVGKKFLTMGKNSSIIQLKIVMRSSCPKRKGDML